jgi:hypothetical protein
VKAELFAHVKEIDPVAADADLPAGAWPAAVVLHEIERRMGMKPNEAIDQQRAEVAEPAATSEPVTLDEAEELRPRRTSPATRRSRPLPAAIAAVLVLVVGLGTWLVLDQSEDAAASALGVGNEYIEAFSRGDAEAVLALLTSDAAISEDYGGGADLVDREFYEQRLAWNTAQGTVFVSPECAVTGETAGVEVTVTCRLGWLNSAEQAIGKPPAPTVLTLVVTSAGISELAFVHEPQFGVGHFDSWMATNHPDDAAIVEFGDWSSVADAERGGRLRAQYVAEWAVFLEANGCRYEVTRAGEVSCS